MRPLCACGRVLRLDDDLEWRCFICKPRPPAGWLQRGFENARAAVASPFKAFRATHRHVRRGSVYQVVGRAEVQAAAPVGEGGQVTVYRDAEGRLWARPTPEFEDGRFEAITETQGAEHG